MSLNQKVYFPNLNGLRFFAAFVVILHHLHQFLLLYGDKNSWHNPIIHSIGNLGVKLFFVLSGFLITYLLLSEEFFEKKISIKDFYIRRILRIWPLYFIILILGFFVLPEFEIFQFSELTTKLNSSFYFYLLLSILFMPNLVLDGYGVVVPCASQSWSVGVEEQFYLIWPVLMKLIKNRMQLLLGVIVTYCTLEYWFLDYMKDNLYWNNKLQIFRYFFGTFSISSMAIGGIFAFWLFEKKSKILKLINNNVTFTIALLVTISMIYFSVSFEFLTSEIYSVLFGILILNFASNQSIKSVFEFEPLMFLGKISYGLYMYHPIAIVLAIALFRKLYLLDFQFLLLVVSVLFTVILATISYYIIEIKFIKYKKLFSSILSGDNVK